MEKYSEWVSEDKYMILNRVKIKKFRIRNYKQNRMITYDFPIENDVLAIKCSKRGNDVCVSRVDFANLFFLVANHTLKLVRLKLMFSQT